MISARRAAAASLAALLASIATAGTARAACVGADLFSVCHGPRGNAAIRQGELRLPEADVVIPSPRLPDRSVEPRRAPRERTPAPFRRPDLFGRPNLLPCVGTSCDNPRVAR